jgi:hypothetical protein
MQFYVLVRRMCTMKTPLIPSPAYLPLPQEKHKLQTTSYIIQRRFISRTIRILLAGFKTQKFSCVRVAAAGKYTKKRVNFELCLYRVFDARNPSLSQ